MNCLVFVLPLLIFFHWGTAHYGTALLAPQDIGALLRFFGATSTYLPPMLVGFVLLAQHLTRGDPWKVQPKTLAGMAGESIVWMVPLIVISHVSGRLLAQSAVTAQPQDPGLLQMILLAVGAGIYEEFIFRLMLISACMLLLVDVFGLKKELAAIAVTVAAAAVFSLYHFAGGRPAGWESFPWAQFIFRMAAGIYLGAIFLWRGYAIVVGAHALFDVYVAISKL